MLDQSLAVVDPDDCARGVEGYAPSGNAGGRALAGVCGGKAPTSSRRSWSINAFCVTVKAFS